jgi:hypothetical protein
MPDQIPNPDFGQKPTYLESGKIWINSGLLSAIAIMVWYVATEVNENKQAIRALKASQESMHYSHWTRNEQRHFANELQWSNTDPSQPLKVPDTDQISARFR